MKNCPECGIILSSKVVCNIYGTFCSKTCIDLATIRGYPKRIEEAINDLRDCFENAPVDFLGTGSDTNRANKEEKEWRNTYNRCLNDIENYLITK